MVDHFSDLTYYKIMISTRKEENLAVKSAFEIWYAKFGVKYIDIIQTMVYFLNNLSEHQYNNTIRQ